MPQLSQILLIDDDQVNNFLNLRLLKRLDIAAEVEIASSGIQGLAYIKERLAQQEPLPPLIFLDINMPVMDGFEFLEKFTALALPATLPTIIMLTTSTNARDLEQASQSAAVAGYLSKPLTEDKIMKVVEKHF